MTFLSRLTRRQHHFELLKGFVKCSTNMYATCSVNSFIFLDKILFLLMPYVRVSPSIRGPGPNENREVVLYDHFAADNSSLKFIIKF